jgi:hypothetical protein
MGVDEGTTDTATPDATSSFHEIATAAIAGLGDPEADAGQAAAPAEATDNATETAEQGTEVPTDQKADDGKADETTDEEHLPPDLRGLDRESMPDELKPHYDRLVETYKSMQRGFTPKLMEGAAAKKEAESLASQVEELTSRLEALTNQPVKQDPQDPNAWLMQGLRGISWADVKASDDPDLYAEWVREQGVIEGRRAASEALASFVSVLAPRLTAVEETVQSFTQAEYARELKSVDAFFSENDDVVPFRGDMATMIEAGLATDIADAAEKVRAIRLGPQREAATFKAAIDAAKNKQREVEGKQDQFSVPASSTGDGGVKFTSDQSFKQIAAAAVAGMGG